MAGHIDAFTCNVGAVENEADLSKIIFICEQVKDAFGIKQNLGNYNSKREFFLDSDDIFYKSKSNGKYQLYVPQTLMLNFMGINHDLV